GDGRRPAGDRLPRRAGARGDRGRRRRLPARPAGRHRAPDATHRRAPERPAPPARGEPPRAGDGRRALHLGALRGADRDRLRGRLEWGALARRRATDGGASDPARRDVSARVTSRPVLFVTGHAPLDRIGAFARLSEREGVEFALFGGRSRHGFQAAEADARPKAGADAPAELPFPHRHLAQREIATLAASGRSRAVVCSTGGRVALPAAWAGARRARAALILWTSLWAHPRSAAHLASYQGLRRLSRSAHGVVTY